MAIFFMQTPEQIKKYQKEWRTKNSEKRAAYAKVYHAAWYEKNKDKKQNQNKEWDKANPQKRRAIQDKHRQKYPEKEKVRDKRYREMYPEKVRKSSERFRKTEKGYFSSYKNGALRRNYAFDLEYADFVKILLMACSYCGVEKAMGIDRVDNTKGYIEGNCAPCCTHCNRMKWAHSTEFFLEHIKKITTHLNML